jgi:hypothetical protein
MTLARHPDPRRAAICFPAAKPGRKPEFNWELIETECHRLMDHHGYFDVSDPEWDCQARLEEALKRFCQDNWQREPAGSTWRQRLPEWIPRSLSIWHD